MLLDMLSEGRDVTLVAAGMDALPFIGQLLEVIRRRLSSSYRRAQT